MPNAKTEALLYRNQFILGPSFIDELESWKRVRFGKSIYLTVHPGLNVCQATHQDRSILLLGFMLDPEHPQAHDFEIIDNLVRSFLTFDDLLECTGKFGGRWILIVDDGREVKLFNDATGLRQVFFNCPNLTQDTWCASQAGLIAKVLKLRMDEEAVSFIEWYRAKSKDFRWPGDSTPYKEVRHLLPNHFLDLQTREVHRFWPNKRLNKFHLNEAIDKIVPIFFGLMHSASHRFDLVVALSAGWDSRLMLAACRDVKDKITFMTVKRLGMSENDPDLRIPCRIASQLNLRHDLVKVQPDLRDEFMDAFNQNVPFPHVAKNAEPMQTQLDYYNQTKVHVVGNVSEVARCYYKLKHGEQITPSRLASLTGMNHPFAIGFFERWLSSFDNNTYGFSIPDLLYWEEKCASWLAMDHLEYDIAWQDMLTPYNTRDLLVYMLSVDEMFRQPPKFELYQKLMAAMWPETLSEPIHSVRYQKNVKYYVTHVRRYLSRFALLRQVYKTIRPAHRVASEL
jgi:hypothetical protein